MKYPERVCELAQWLDDNGSGTHQIAASYLRHQQREISSLSASIAELEAQLAQLSENYKTCCMVNDSILHNAEELRGELKTAKRDALQKLADGLEIPPTKEGPFIWSHLHSQIMNEIDALDDANTIGTKDEL